MRRPPWPTSPHYLTACHSLPPRSTRRPRASYVRCSTRCNSTWSSNRATARSMSQSPSTIAAARQPRTPHRFVRRTGWRPRQWRPRQDSNLRSRLRRPMLYPLSYEGIWPVGPEEPVDRARRDVSAVTAPLTCCLAGSSTGATRAHHDVSSGHHVHSRSAGPVGEHCCVHAGPAGRSRPSRSIRTLSTWSARHGATTATGRPISPSTPPSGRDAAPATWPPRWWRCSGPSRPLMPRRSRWPARGSSTSTSTTAGCTTPWPRFSTRARRATPVPTSGHGERVQVEFISANPTGPIHVGNGWWGSYGDALARVLARAGYRVSREYYVNDTGGQIRTLGESLLARRRGRGGSRGRLPGRVRDRPGRQPTPVPTT